MLIKEFGVEYDVLQELSWALGANHIPLTCHLLKSPDQFVLPVSTLR